MMDEINFNSPDELEFEIKPSESIAFEVSTPFKGEKGEPGLNGRDGEQGMPGKDFTFDQFTPEQLEMLKGQKGDKGEPGLNGRDGRDGEQGPPGKKGDTPVIEIGAVNLLRNTATLQLGNREKSRWDVTSGGNGKIQILDIANSPNPLVNKMLRVSGNTNGGNKDLSQTVNLEVGKKYTISCYARLASDSNLRSVRMLIRSWANNTDIPHRLYADVNHTEWRRYSFTFTALAASNSIQFGQNADGSIEICGPQIEQGNMATDYAPNPDDTTAGSNRIQFVNTNYKYYQNGINDFSKTGYTGDWNTTNITEQMSVGDMAIVKVFNLTKNSDSYILGEIVNINHNYSLKIRSFGLLDKGEKGDKGDKGEPGVNGNDGAKGADAKQIQSISISPLSEIELLFSDYSKLSTGTISGLKDNVKSINNVKPLSTGDVTLNAVDIPLTYGGSKTVLSEFDSHGSKINGLERKLNELTSFQDNLARTAQPGDWETFDLGWGAKIKVLKIGQIVYWQIDYTGNNGLGARSERVPNKYRPLNNEVALVVSAIHTGTSSSVGSGAFFIRKDNKIFYSGATGHNEYRGSGSYIALTKD